MHFPIQNCTVMWALSAATIDRRIATVFIPLSKETETISIGLSY